MRLTFRKASIFIRDASGLDASAGIGLGPVEPAELGPGRGNEAVMVDDPGDD
jgi:hypothetical protein